MIYINGLILGAIGALILLTPLAVEIPPEKLYLDIVAGATLLLIGIVCLIYEIFIVRKK